MDIKRLDHLGIIAGVIKDLKLIETIDQRLKKDEYNQENITPGEAIAGMIINGLGFSNKPLSLTPHFFETKALEVLFRPGITASYFNRHKLGKTLDASHEYGCEQLFYELSSRSCTQEGIHVRFNSEDTTSFSLTGEYAEDIDEHTIKITHGYSKDHRPDLKQVVQELLVSQDGGIPLMMQSWDGNASDNQIFKARAERLIEHFKKSELPRYLIADSKLYFADNADYLKQLNFITRIPGNIAEENKAILESVKNNRWERLDDSNQFATINIDHYNIQQRWIVVHSDQARKRAEKTLGKSVKKERDELEKKLWHLSNQPYGCAEDARNVAEQIVKKHRYHKISEIVVKENKKYERTGRPKKGKSSTHIQYFIIATVVADSQVIHKKLDEKSCYVIGTNIDAEALGAAEVVLAYKNQNSCIENMGFRFLKDPLFFVSSLFLKKPGRIMGLLMVMTLALLVYSIAQRRMRNALKETNETLPNQINQPSKTPTMRWIFQLMDGIHFVKIKVDGMTKTMIHGINELQRKIIGLLGHPITQIYRIPETPIFDMEGSAM